MDYLEIALAALIAGTLDTVVGFGGTLLLMPILVMVVGPVDAVLLAAIIPLGWNGVRISIAHAWIDWKRGGLIAAGVVAGGLLGGLYLEAVDPGLITLGLGALLLLFGLYYIIRLYIEIPRLHDLPVALLPIIGAAAGGVSAILGAGNGPVQTIALHGAGLSSHATSATNGLLGALAALARLGGYALAGSIGEINWGYGLVGLVASGAGAVVGLRFVRKTRDTTLELVIGIALVLAAVRLLMP